MVTRKKKFMDADTDPVAVSSAITDYLKNARIDPDEAVEYWKIAAAARRETSIDTCVEGEDDAADPTIEIPVYTVVDLSCPLCAAPMEGRLTDKITNNLTREHYYTVVSKQCDCPEIYFHRQLK